MQNEEQRGEQYARMSELGDYRVSDEDPDPRGWSVVGRDGATIGRVNDLIVDTAAMKVRYLDIAVTDAAATGSSRARIPASRVDLEPAQRTVVTDLSRAELSAFLGSEPDAASDAGQQPWNGAADVAGEPRSRTTDVRAREGSDVERLTRAEEELADRQARGAGRRRWSSASTSRPSASPRRCSAASSTSGSSAGRSTTPPARRSCARARSACRSWKKRSSSRSARW